MDNNIKQHIASFVSARIACSMCITNGEWKNSVPEEFEKRCKICGPFRTIAFCQVPFKETKVDKMVVNATPIRAFLDWVLYQLKGRSDTLLFAHNGGRFDTVMLMKEIYNQGINADILNNVGSSLLLNWLLPIGMGG